MAAIDINIKKVQDANTRLPAVRAELLTQKEHIRMLKWKIPMEIQERRYIGERLTDILRDLSRAEERMKELYHVTEGAVVQYRNTEKKITANAEKFR
ncbi:MAG: hypothetical protein NC254_09450 [bacterium]|nr:hypothetical protein [bacterium]